ncbi:MAG: S8 family serine peptidase [Candidatus Nitrosocosmicus sp.]|nr:S8 family serine peptidase [Candidatus Nitrosocosmicus sp.]
MRLSSGNPEINIGVIDGPVDITHPAFQGSRIKTVEESQIAACKDASDLACIHGTFITGILSAKRGVPAPSICPNCTIILNPIFQEKTNCITDQPVNIPSSTPAELAKAIIRTIDAGSKVVNLSVGLSTSSITTYDEMFEVYDYAIRRGVIIVVAAGNQGNIGHNSLVSHDWPIPIVACDSTGKFSSVSNFGSSIGKNGLMAPGIDIESTYPGGGYISLSGTSVATSFVTGAIALLWSLFPDITAAELIQSIRQTNHQGRKLTILPPLLNIRDSYYYLRGKFN